MSDTDRIGDTDLNVADLALIGEAVLNLAGAAALMRHASPAGVTDYAAPATAHQRIACAFAAWCGGKQALGADLTTFLQESGWIDHMAAATEAAAS